MKESYEILDVAGTFLIHMHVPKTFWVDSIYCACHLINRMSYLLHDKILFHCLLSNKLTFSVIPPVFGSTCFIQNFNSRLDKLEPRAVKYIFAGYSGTQKVYCCFDQVHHQFDTFSDVTFFEPVSYMAPPGSPSVLQNMITSRYSKK